ncbi:hypothetical protein D3C85_1344000 [compost metagenome]
MNEEFFEEPLYFQMEGFIQYYDRVCENISKEKSGVLDHMEICLLLCMTAKQYSNPYWVVRFESYFDKLQETFFSQGVENFIVYDRLSKMKAIYINPILDYEQFCFLTNSICEVELFVFCVSNYKKIALNFV